MKNISKIKVYYSDTDAYGIVWHGNYLRWFEIGRMEYSKQLGIDMNFLQENNIVIPVVEINLKYKTPAKLNDELIIETETEKITPASMSFRQQIRKVKDDAICVTGIVKIVAVDNNGVLYRRLPRILTDAFKEWNENKNV